MVIRHMLSSFTVSRLNRTTFAITEDDSYGEQPIIYAKIQDDPSLLILTDTGCNSPSKRCENGNAKYTHLRHFLEACPVETNNNQPINPDGLRSYVIICSHCHFDHIAGIEQFIHNDAQSIHSSPPHPTAIVASAAGRDFVTKDLPTHSLCELTGVKTPEYTVSCWAENNHDLLWHSNGSIYAQSTLRSGQQNSDAQPLGITIYNTPGHTPDELAWYDQHERHLFVGDSFYKLEAEDNNPDVYGGPIIFPKEGDWPAFFFSMRYLLQKVKEKNRDCDSDHKLSRVKVSCGHTTVGADAQETIESVLAFFARVIKGEVPIIDKETIRGETNCLWHDEDSKWAVRAPRRLCEEAQRARVFE